MNKNPELDKFLASWQIDPINAKKAFNEYSRILAEDPSMELEFIARPAISYSLRGKKNGKIRALIDVVDDEPENRWLSVCFYADMINDKDETGDFVPQGLLGEDAICFNLDEEDENMKKYIAERIKEAVKK